MVIKQQRLIIHGTECLALVFGLRTQALAVWPPSTAFEEQTTSILYGFVVIAFIIGIVLGIWSQRDHHEHK